MLMLKTVLIMLATWMTVATTAHQDNQPQPRNLDKKNIDVTALYLNRTTIRLNELAKQAERTGNYVNFNQAAEVFRSELELWNNERVEWALQVRAIGEQTNQAASMFNTPHDLLLSFHERYQFKNKATLQIIVQLQPKDRTANEPVDTVEYDEQWAKTLKRGDYVTVEGKLKTKTDGNMGNMTAPIILCIEPYKYSKYVPAPVKKK